MLFTRLSSRTNYNLISHLHDQLSCINYNKYTNTDTIVLQIIINIKNQQAQLINMFRRLSRLLLPNWTMCSWGLSGHLLRCPRWAHTMLWATNLLRWPYLTQLMPRPVELTKRNMSVILHAVTWRERGRENVWINGHRREITHFGWHSIDTTLAGRRTQSQSTAKQTRCQRQFWQGWGSRHWMPSPNLLRSKSESPEPTVCTASHRMGQYSNRIVVSLL
jgi:hypothetical protein